jgi:hypothetical protein
MAARRKDPYKALFAQYRKDLRWAYNVAKERHDRLVRRYRDEEGIDEEEAHARVVAEDGPMAHEGQVIYVVRKYWLEVARIKKEIQETNPDSGWLEPLAFLVERLEEEADDDEDEDLLEMLEEMAYWPIGLNEQDEWC